LEILYAGELPGDTQVKLQYLAGKKKKEEKISWNIDTIRLSKSALLRRNPLNCESKMQLKKKETLEPNKPKIPSLSHNIDQSI
jgi:hypothetical protein